LFHNEGGGQFRYATLTAGLAAATARSSGWGTGFYDFDNDGWKDLFVGQGHVLDNVERMNSGLRYLEPPALFRNQGGRFEKCDLQAPAVAGRGVAFGDLRNDGSVAVVMNVLGGRPLIFRGRAGGHWLSLRLVGTRSNRDGQGARVRVGKQWAYVSTSGSYLSASDPRVHFGLGEETRATVEILWPSGARQVLERVPAGGVVTVKEAP